MENKIISKIKINPMDKILKVMKSQKDDKSFSLLELHKKKDADLKSDIVYPEDNIICTLEYNDDFLVSCGLKPLYKDYTDNLLRKRFSMDRQSRKEFVEVNKKDTLDDGMQKLGNMKNLTEVRS